MLGRVARIAVLVSNSLLEHGSTTYNMYDVYTYVFCLEPADTSSWLSMLYQSTLRLAFKVDTLVATKCSKGGVLERPSPQSGAGLQPRSRVVVHKPSLPHSTKLACLMLSLSRAQAGDHCPRAHVLLLAVAKDVAERRRLRLLLPS
jgi:hypothetical protein